MKTHFDPFGDLDRFTAQLPQFRPGARFMPVDLFREGDEYVLNADLPGVDPGSIDVDLDGNILTIRAQRTADTHAGAKWLAQERSGGNFMRQFTLGDGIATESISATYDNGVLTVVIPVSERAKPRKISVTSPTDSRESIEV